MDLINGLNLFLKSSLGKLGLNWLDSVILIVLLLYAVEGYSAGFILALFDLVSFVLSFIIGLKFYSFIAALLTRNFSVSAGFSNAIGFLIIVSLSEIIIGLFLRKIIYYPFTVRFRIKGRILENIDHVLGAVSGIFSGLVLIAFLLTVIIALPVSVFLKHSVSESKIGDILNARTQRFEKDLNNIFGGAINETLNFLTVKPESNETLNLNFRTNKFSVDRNAEIQMFSMVNNERTSRGFKALVIDGKLTQVAREHCEDMFSRGYFSHYTPEGLSPFDRMAQNDVSFSFAGENLALAPNVTIAMQGFMQSPGHRANILFSNFGKIGIGVIDGEIYGEMFCQEFTD